MTSLEDQRANDLCACGSGKRYKLCHKPLHRTKSERFLDEARKFYVERWSKNASAHAAHGDYEWMLDQLPAGAKRVLDIDVGDGAGVAAMFKRWAPDRIVPVEENPECFNLCRRRSAALADVEVVGRLSAESTGEGGELNLAARAGRWRPQQKSGRKARALRWIGRLSKTDGRRINDGADMTGSGLIEPGLRQPRLSVTFEEDGIIVRTHDQYLIEQAQARAPTAARIMFQHADIGAWVERKAHMPKPDEDGVFVVLGLNDRTFRVSSSREDVDIRAWLTGRCHISFE